MRKWSKRLWSWYRQIAAIRGLLQWTGWWESVSAAVVSTLLSLGAVIKGLPWPITVLIALTAFVLVSLAIRLWQAAPSNSPVIPGFISDQQHQPIASTLPGALEKKWDSFPRVLEAVIQSPLHIGKTGYLLATVSGPHSSGLEKVLCSSQYSALKWGELKHEMCKVHFRQEDERTYKPTIVQLRLKSIDLKSSDESVNIELEWDRDPSSPVRFSSKQRGLALIRQKCSYWNGEPCEEL
jgi:hypothetical protein